ncbi:MAG TPA: twin-arginine translocation signal domain-containing protein [Phycisphaerae bacterium]|nr:twin-arginine translocation signal domain-containing protein [Phycisphaerae bacterium]
MNSSDPPLSRRHFLTAAAALTLSAATGNRARAAPPAPTKISALPPRPFEVGIAVYAWDLHDESINQVLDNLQLAAVNNIYILGEMHPEKRPATTAVFPHNPVRKTWMAEDSRVYWHPDMSRYGRIKPLLSAHDWLNQTDWVETLATAVRKRGLSTGVEISHSLIDRQRAEGELSDCAQRDIHGNISHNHFRPACMNHPDVRAYILNLYTELAERYDVDLIMSANIPFDEGGPATGGCFCDSCVKAAAAENFDLPAAKAALLLNPSAEPHASRWRRFRCACTAKLYKEIRAAVHAARKKRSPTAPVDFRFSLFMTKRNPGDWGVDLSLMRDAVDSIRVQEYSEDTGDPKILETKRAYLTTIAHQLRPTPADAAFPINSAIGVRPRATPDLIKTGIAIAKDCRMSGITLSQYDGAPLPLLQSVRTALAAAQLLPT